MRSLILDHSLDCAQHCPMPPLPRTRNMLFAYALLPFFTPYVAAPRAKHVNATPRYRGVNVIVLFINWHAVDHDSYLQEQTALLYTFSSSFPVSSPRRHRSCSIPAESFRLNAGSGILCPLQKKSNRISRLEKLEVKKWPPRDH